MEEGKNKYGVLVGMLMGLLVAAVIGGFLYFSGIVTFKEDKPETEEVVTEEKECPSIPITTYASVAGLYKYTSDKMTDATGNEFRASYTIYLYENGTFKYEFSAMSPRGYMGNYTIVGDKVKLNYLFETTSGWGLRVTSGSHELTIGDNTLTDNEQLLTYVDLTSVTLEKNSDEKTYLEAYEFYHVLDTNPVFNNAE